MSGSLDKTLKILEFLSSRPKGAELVEIAAHLAQSRSGAHRTLLELSTRGYIRQTHKGGYQLTVKLPAMGINWLSQSGLIEIANPILSRLADRTKEVVRLVVVEDKRLVNIAKTLPSGKGPIHDPDMGTEVPLLTSAAGHALLMTLKDEEVVKAAQSTSNSTSRTASPNSIAALLQVVQNHRSRGFSIVEDSHSEAVNSVAAPVRRRDEGTNALIVVSGPSVRFTTDRIFACAGDLLDAASELALTGRGTPLL